MSGYASIRSEDQHPPLGHRKAVHREPDAKKGEPTGLASGRPAMGPSDLARWLPARSVSPTANGKSFTTDLPFGPTAVASRGHGARAARGRKRCARRPHG